MSFIFIDHKEKDNLILMEVPNKEKYYYDLMDIEHSLTGRLDVLLSNTFIHEAVQLIINAIVLFEKGYIDCSFYSLRQSLEVSTTMVYLVELSPEERDRKLLDWKSQSYFPMYDKMLRLLSKNGAAFADIKAKMTGYFNQIQEVKNLLNKHVHKQGFNTFYVSRSHILNSHKDQLSIRLLEDFENCIKRCIGAVAILRLAVDPFPILLMDEEIYARTGDFVTEAYSQEFVEEYIGIEEINVYKQTEVYREIYESIMGKEKRVPSVLDVVKHQYIDKEKFEEIINQAHLLGRIDLLAVLISVLSDKIAAIYCYDGLAFYFTNTKSKRQSGSFDSRVLKNIKQSNDCLNVPYDEAFLSFITVCNEEFFIEHNEIFSKDEFETISNMISEINEMSESSV